MRTSEYLIKKVEPFLKDLEELLNIRFVHADFYYSNHQSTGKLEKRTEIYKSFIHDETAGIDKLRLERGNVENYQFDNGFEGN